MKKIVIMLIVLSSCSFVPDDASQLISNQKQSPFDPNTPTPTLSLAQKDKLFPYFNLNVDGFSAYDMDPPNANPTEAQKIASRTFSVKAKLYKLQALDFIRFVIHTSEFEEEMLKTKFVLVTEGTGPLGTTKKGDIADPRRVLDILKNVYLYNLNISKWQMADTVGAQGVLGFFRYNHPVSAFSNRKASYRIWFRNDEDFENGSHADPRGYHTGIMLHEILHNLGFNHDWSVSGTDVVYGTQGVFNAVHRKAGFIEKYKKELARFSPYYQIRHAEHLVADTVVGIAATRSRSLSLPFQRSIDIEYYGDDVVVCQIHEDGSHELTTYGKIKSKI
ncbi:MAG: hypothetical protein ACRC9L_09645 [Brevinema sp.]